MQCTNILKTAERLFASKGFKGTSLNDIAEEVGLRKATIYHYFKSKEEILFKIMNDEMDRAFSNLEKIKISEIPKQDKFREILKFYIKYYVGHQEGLILLVNEQDNLTVEHKEILVEKQRKYVRFFYNVLSELKSGNIIKDIPFPVITFAFFGMVHYTVNWYNGKGDITVDELTDFFIDILTKGIEVKNE